jgi:CubicO group peptidase (beta-lactamase class C family)
LRYAALVLALAGFGTASAQGDDAVGARFSRGSLEAGQPAVRLMPFAAFAPAHGARPPGNRFEGRLALKPGSEARFRTHRDADNDGGDQTARELPPFDFVLVQEGDRLLPEVRGPIVGAHERWEWILAPGRVWDEEGDAGFTRAGLPFALKERNANCTHYGALTFLFKSDGTISRAAYQIAGETCAYFKFDLHGIARAIYTPGKVANGASIVAAHKAEEAARMPTAPIQTLAVDRPGADPAQFGSIEEVDPRDMTAYGFVLNGKHYVSGCHTRAGPYLDCDTLPLPSYSTAKTLVAGLAAMRMELLHLGALASTVASLVPECRADHWGDVTLGHALNMTTGNLRSKSFEADEESEAMQPFFLAETHTAKIAMACELFPRQVAPGSTFAYHTVDTYILGSALSALWRLKHGQNADYYSDLIVDPVWRTLRLSPLTHRISRTYDQTAQPFTGYGLTYTRDDIARIAVFLNDKAGVLDGKALFDPTMLKSALQRDPDERGVVANGKAFRYRNGFWAWDATDELDCKHETWIPFMSGYGGITVMLLPNATVYYYFSDGEAFEWERAVTESNRLRPFC